MNAQYIESQFRVFYNVKYKILDRYTYIELLQYCNRSDN